MDTPEQNILDETPERVARRRRSIEEKRRISEETLEAGASVARVARRHAVNANQVFYWRTTLVVTPLSSVNIITNGLPTGQMQAAYTFPLQATGGTPP